MKMKKSFARAGAAKLGSVQENIDEGFSNVL
jgi:hypothetical protein